MALIVSYVAKWFIRIQEKSFFILELPTYRSPRWKNIFQTMLNKARVFVTDAGKIIMIISLILWALSSFGPPSRMKNIESSYQHSNSVSDSAKNDFENNMHAKKLENSYAGILGKTIEPIIRPLGYDWKIGIALITSFAAREVFVGTMATLYSVGEDDQNSLKLQDKLRNAKKPNGEKLYTLATGLSLMIFYLFAMQCMSTLAIVYRETKSLKWPIIQLLYMTGLAYLMSFLVYRLFS
jgi:ferrous iron transport protein B